MPVGYEWLLLFILKPKQISKNPKDPQSQKGRDRCPKRFEEAGVYILRETIW